MRPLAAADPQRRPRADRPAPAPPHAAARRDLRIADGVITEMGRGLRTAAGRARPRRDRLRRLSGLGQHPPPPVPVAAEGRCRRASTATLTPWLKAVPYAHRGGFDEATLRLAARIGLVELMLSGCTTIADHHYIYYPGMGFDPSEVLFDEAEKLGVRFMLLRGGAHADARRRSRRAGAPAAGVARRDARCGRGDRAPLPPARPARAHAASRWRRPR